MRSAAPVRSTGITKLMEMKSMGILVPCWGDRGKVPPHLRHHFDALKRLIFASTKPVKIFGLTAGGDPKHPLMLGYDTQLVDWAA